MNDRSRCKSDPGYLPPAPDPHIGQIIDALAARLMEDQGCSRSAALFALGEIFREALRLLPVKLRDAALGEGK